MVATNVQAAGGTRFSLETLFKVARSEEKEARQIYAMEGLVMSATMDAPTIYSSITNADGLFTAVSWRGGKSSSPPKQQLQSRSHPRLSNGIATVNPFDEKFLNSFRLSGGLAMEPSGTIDIANSKLVIGHGFGGILIPANWCNSLKACCWSKQ